MFFAVPILVAGCSEKERGEPRASVLLHLSYTFNTEERDLFSDVAASGDVLVYRGDGTLLEHRAMTPREIAAAAVQLSVPRGDSYTAVVWVNLERELYALRDEHLLSTMCVEPLSRTGYVEGVMPELLHGACAFTTAADAPHEQSLPLRSLTNRVTVILDGAMNWTRAAGTPYELQIAGTGGVYGWDAGPLPGRGLIYLPGYTPDFPGYDKALGATFHLLHLTPEDDFRLIVFNGPDIIYNQPLVGVLMQNPAIDSGEELWRHGFYYLRFDSNMELVYNGAMSLHPDDCGADAPRTEIKLNNL